MDHSGFLKDANWLHVDNDRNAVKMARVTNPTVALQTIYSTI